MGSQNPRPRESAYMGRNGPRKKLSLASLVTLQNLISPYHAMWAHVGVPKIFFCGRWCLALLRLRGMFNRKQNGSLPICMGGATVLEVGDHFLTPHFLASGGDKILLRQLSQPNSFV